MPGPCSAPNGIVSIVEMKRDKPTTVHSGKTALKRGEIAHVRRGGKPVAVTKSKPQVRRNTKMSRKRRQEQEQD